MTVTRFKSFEEAEKALWCLEPDEEYYHRLHRIYDLFGKMIRVDYPRGIHKYPDLDSANRQKAEWDVVISLKKSEKYKK
jgi:hypothetical protein